MQLPAHTKRHYFFPRKKIVIGFISNLQTDQQVRARTRIENWFEVKTRLNKALKFG